MLTNSYAQIYAQHNVARPSRSTAPTGVTIPWNSLIHCVSAPWPGLPVGIIFFNLIFCSEVHERSDQSGHHTLPTGTPPSRLVCHLHHHQHREDTLCHQHATRGRYCLLTFLSWGHFTRCLCTSQRYYQVLPEVSNQTKQAETKAYDGIHKEPR